MGLEVSASVGGVYELGILSRRGESYPTFKFTINNPPPVPLPPPCKPSQPFSFIALVLLGKEDGGLPIARWGHGDAVMGGGLSQATVASAQASVLCCPGDTRCLQDLIPPPPPISGFGVLGALENGSPGGSVSV